METPLLLEALVDDLLQRMGFDARVTVRETGTTLAADVDVREGAGALIGNRGEGLDALEDLVRRIGRRRIPDIPRVVVYVNGYRREQATALREYAREIADRVRRSREAYTFKPMSSRERRIIHLELAARADIITESFGEGEGRHVVVRPAL